MKYKPQKFNRELFLLALAIIQPASAKEVFRFLKNIFPEIKNWPTDTDIHNIARRFVDISRIHEVRKNYYSLTSRGNESLTKNERRVRDKLRLHLLRRSYDATLRLSETGVKELGGASPSSESSMGTKEAPRPAQAGPVPSRLEAIRHRAGLRWPRVVEQLPIVGLDAPVSDTMSLRGLRYCSFATLRTLQAADDSDGPERDMTLSQFALAVGISPRLVSYILRRPKSHYRTFELPKKSGGSRTIHAPRFFLKTLQYWLRDYILWQMKIHPCCHAYVRGRSIITNALEHSKRAYVANLDIKNFFDSIRTNDIEELAVINGIGVKLAHLTARLTTLNGSLPQGAPTSPLISNAYLFYTDTKIHEKCEALGIIYTRYADDITISGDRKDKVYEGINFVRKVIERKGLYLNEGKTRIASAQASQRVTGLVVNEGVRPPRVYRRRVRSEFHHAVIEGIDEISKDKIDRLRGHLSYLRSFPLLRGSEELKKYLRILENYKQ